MEISLGVLAVWLVANALVVLAWALHRRALAGGDACSDVTADVPPQRRAPDAPVAADHRTGLSSR